MNTSYIREEMPHIIEKEGNLTNDAQLMGNGSIVVFGLAVNGGKKADGTEWPADFFNCKIFAKKGETIPQNKVDVLKKGTHVVIKAHFSNNDYEKDGETLRPVDLIVCDLSVGFQYKETFSGRIFGDPIVNENGRVSFMVSQSNGKDANGEWRKDTVIRCQTTKSDIQGIELIKKNAKVIVRGFSSTYEKTTEKGNKYRALIFNVVKVEPVQRFLVTLDEDGNFVKKTLWVEPDEDLPM